MTRDPGLPQPVLGGGGMPAGPMHELAALVGWVTPIDAGTWVFVPHVDELALQRLTAAGRNLPRVGRRRRTRR